MLEQAIEVNYKDDDGKARKKTVKVMVAETADEFKERTNRDLLEVGNELFLSKLRKALAVKFNPRQKKDGSGTIGYKIDAKDSAAIKKYVRDYVMHRPSEPSETPGVLFKRNFTEKQWQMILDAREEANE